MRGNGHTSGWVIALWPAGAWRTYSFKPPSFPPIRVHRELGFTGVTLCKVSGRLTHHLVAICRREMVPVLLYQYFSIPGMLWIGVYWNPDLFSLPRCHSICRCHLNKWCHNSSSISNIKTYASSLIPPFISTFLSNLSAKCCQCQFYLLSIYVSDWNAFLLLYSQPKNPSLHLTQNILPNWSLCFPSWPFHTQCPARRQELLKGS